MRPWIAKRDRDRSDRIGVCFPAREPTVLIGAVGDDTRQSVPRFTPRGQNSRWFERRILPTLDHPAVRFLSGVQDDARLVPVLTGPSSVIAAECPDSGVCASCFNHVTPHRTLTKRPGCFVTRRLSPDLMYLRLRGSSDLTPVGQIPPLVARLFRSYHSRVPTYCPFVPSSHHQALLPPLSNPSPSPASWSSFR